jgi:hypothetical protein
MEWRFAAGVLSGPLFFCPWNRFNPSAGKAGTPDSAIAPVSQVLTLTGGGRPMIRGISGGYRAMLRILVLAILIPIAVVIAVAIFGAFFWSAG